MRHPIFFDKYPDTETAMQVARMVYPEVLGDLTTVTPDMAVDLFETLECHRKLVINDRLGTLAFGAINTSYLSSYGVAHLESICVRPDSHRDGVGRQTVELLCSEADALGANAVILDSLPQSEGFYRKLGFINLGNDPLRFAKKLE